ncbi:MAG TPA: class I SAM-dependent methyltransferase [Planktothrix sp.]|jgi:SAM-dependent methyltransferase
MKTKTNWWAEFYEGTPFEEFLTRTNEKEVQTTLDFLVDELELTPCARVFDQCCGFASIALPLAQRGFTLVGVDLCEKYIKMAIEAAQRQQSPAEFYCADAFSFVAQPQCDAAFNWYTSFGYSDSDAENIRMIERAYDSLKVGGKFALEFPNIAYLLKNFQSEIRRTQESAAGTIEVLRQCAYLPEKGVMTQRWQYTMPEGKVIVKDTSLRLYMPHSIVEMFEQCHFKDVRVYADFNRGAVTLESPRCIFVGRKEGQ